MKDVVSFVPADVFEHLECPRLVQLCTRRFYMCG